MFEGCRTIPPIALLGVVDKHKISIFYTSADAIAR